MYKDFLNKVIQIRTEFTPYKLLERIKPKIVIYGNSVSTIGNSLSLICNERFFLLEIALHENNQVKRVYRRHRILRHLRTVLREQPVFICVSKVCD